MTDRARIVVVCLFSTLAIVPVAPRAASADLPIPTLSSPAGSASSTPTFRWDPVTGASDYHLWVNSPTDNVFAVWYPAASICSGDACSVVAPTALSGNEYRWWVQARSGAETGAWSAGLTFTVLGIPGRPGLLGPSGTATAAPTYTWSGASDAAEYLVWVTGPAGVVVQTWYPAASVCAGATCTVTPGGALDSGDYRWWVQARNSSGTGPWSDGLSFTVGIQAPAATTLASPIGTIGTPFPTYRWQAVAGATEHRLFVTNASGLVLDVRYAATAACTLDGCAATPGLALAAGEYRWWVQTSSSSGDGPWSAGLTFVEDPLVGLCDYVANESVNLEEASLNYFTIANGSFAYRASLINDYHYYAAIPDACPADFDGSCLVESNVMVMYQSRVPAAAREAIVLIHGNSVVPDDFFQPTGTYLRQAGQTLYDQGFAVYAPYVTHSSRFQNARRRLAALGGARFVDLDAERVVRLVRQIAGGYDRIHLAGASYGGGLAAAALQQLVASNDPVRAKLGVVLSIEGAVPAENWLNAYFNGLFEWDWEMIYPGFGRSEFLALASLPNLFLAYSSCNELGWTRLYAGITGSRPILHFTGGHEMSVDVFNQALSIFRSTP
jgi:hypothetical protein